MMDSPSVVLKSSVTYEQSQCKVLKILLFHQYHQDTHIGYRVTGVSCHANES